MKVVMLSKALVSGAYQKKLEELARLPNIELVAFVPPAWREPLVGTLYLDHQFTAGYHLEVLPMVANGHHHLYFYRGVRRVLARERPDVVHIDEESFNLATFLAMRAGLAVGARCCFYNWANINRYYPPPFCLFEQYAFRHAAYAIAGNQEAATLMRRHGYTGRLKVLPQFGVDPALFTQPAESAPTHHARQASADAPCFIVGYLGRLIAWKGVLDLVEALPGLPACVHLRLIGDGELRPRLEQRAHELGVGPRVTIRPAVASTAVPDELRQMDTLVLPSRTQPNWKEQFGRILIEAMSCGVPVIGSSSGEIPNVIGDAGLVFPEGDIAALRAAIERVRTAPALREDLARRGRQRVLAHYTQAALARDYYALYREMVE
jgi:glycosyltransferase involved in cell wall biosynthesis